MSRKRPKMLNAAINTSGTSLTWINLDQYKSVRLKERNVKHIRINNSSTLLDSYAYGTKMGEGAFATVVSITEKDTNKEWAMKIINKAMVGEHIHSLQREIQILKMVEHPHIIYLDKVYESPRKLYLVLELCTGELAKIFERKKQFSEPDAKKIITDLVSAVVYLHKNDIVHRDLKLQNILITQNPNDKKDKLFIKLSDFGLSIIKHGSSIEDMLHDYCGTLTYMAPEVITSHSYSQQCDVWALGVIMYLLLSGQFPFYHNGQKELMTIICNKEPSYKNFIASNGAIHLISKMLEKNPAMRITAVEIEMHPWIVGKQMVEHRSSPENVLDMMKLWRSDMRLPTVEDCDWVTSANALESFNKANRTRGSHQKSTDSGLSRQSMKLPIQNIRFDKKRPESTDAANVLKSESLNTWTNTTPVTKVGHGRSSNVALHNQDKKHRLDDPSQITGSHSSKEKPTMNSNLLKNERKKYG